MELAGGGIETSAIVAIVDDDVGVRRALGRLLRSCGVAVALFGSAEEFLAAGGGRDYALVVADVVMGEMSGLDLLETLAAEGRTQRAVVITAHVTESTRERSSQLGATLLPKPIEGADLLSIVGSAIGRDLDPPG